MNRRTFGCTLVLTAVLSLLPEFLREAYAAAVGDINGLPVI